MEEEKKTTKSKKKTYYAESKSRKIYTPPSVAERREFYDKIYKKDEDGKYLIGSEKSFFVN